jgi:hypothetical protein
MLASALAEQGGSLAEARSLGGPAERVAADEGVRAFPGRTLGSEQKRCFLCTEQFGRR